jgi:hypothetical protein
MTACPVVRFCQITVRRVTLLTQPLSGYPSTSTS